MKRKRFKGAIQDMRAIAEFHAIVKNYIKMQKLMKTTIFTIIILTFLSCSPQQRLNRIVKNHPELQRIDTISIHDTIIDPEFIIDSSFVLHNGDTVFIDTSKVKIKVIRLKGDTIRLYINQPSDTIFVDKKIYVPKIVVQKETWMTWAENHKGWLILIGVIILILFILRFIFGRK